jgi:hypothetical protein
MLAAGELAPTQPKQAQAAVCRGNADGCLLVLTRKISNQILEILLPMLRGLN